MTEWAVAGIIFTIAGGAWAIITGVSKIITPLTKQLTTLNLNMEHFSRDLKILTDDNKDAHRRIWQHEDEQDEKIQSHEIRLTLIEKGGVSNEN